MNLVGISNLFNQICQSLNPRVRFYHYGFYSDINTNVQNNFNNNTKGQEYPALQFLLPTGTMEIKAPASKTRLNVELVLSDTQHYNGDNNEYNDRSIVEVHADLEALMINILTEFNRLSRTAPFSAGIEGPINLNYLANSQVDRLCILTANFTIFYVNNCPIDTVDIGALTPPFNVFPPSQVDDYELL